MSVSTLSAHQSVSWSTESNIEEQKQNFGHTTAIQENSVTTDDAISLTTVRVNRLRAVRNSWRSSRQDSQFREQLLPLDLARVLVPLVGSIDPRSCADAQRVLNEPPTPDGVEAEAALMAGILAKDCSLSAAISSLKAPNVGSLGERMVRSITGFCSGLLTDYHSRLAGVTFLLSRIWQEERDCYLVSLCVYMKREYPTRAVNDFQQLIQEGAIHRIWEGKRIKSIPFGISSEGSGLCLQIWKNALGNFAVSPIFFREPFPKERHNWLEHAWHIAIRAVSKKVPSERYATFYDELNRRLRFCHTTSATVVDSTPLWILCRTVNETIVPVTSFVEVGSLIVEAMEQVVPNEKLPKRPSAVGSSFLQTFASSLQEIVGQGVVQHPLKFPVQLKSVYGDAPSLMRRCFATVGVVHTTMDFDPEKIFAFGSSFQAETDRCSYLPCCYGGHAMGFCVDGGMGMEVLQAVRTAAEKIFARSCDMRTSNPIVEGVRLIVESRMPHNVNLILPEPIVGSPAPSLLQLCTSMLKELHPLSIAEEMVWHRSCAKLLLHEPEISFPLSPFVTNFPFRSGGLTEVDRPFFWYNPVQKCWGLVSRRLPELEVYFGPRLLFLTI